MLAWPGMKRLALVILLLSACIDPGPELVWTVEVTSSQLVVGQSTLANSTEALPTGESPMPLTASWYTDSSGIVELSSDIGSTITVKGLAPGSVMLYASAGGAQGGSSREVAIVVSAP